MSCIAYDGSTCCINNDGNVVSFGFSDCGSHGHEEQFVYPPKIIPTLKNIKSIVGGNNHTVCLIMMEMFLHLERIIMDKLELVWIH